MNGYIYIRVSTKEQVDGNSLEDQEKSVRALFAKMSVNVVGLYADKGESAKTTNRPDFLRMTDDCRKNKGKVQFVGVYKIDRFARHAADHQAVKTLLLRYGVQLVSATEPFDDTAPGHLMENVTAAFAQFDNEVRSERSKQGMKSSFEKGYWQWTPPLGYRRILSTNGKSTIEFDSGKGPLLLWGLNEFTKGIFTQMEVLKKLTRRGLRNNDGSKISPQTFQRILRNKFYAGFVVSPKWQIEAKGQHEALISLEVWLRIQKILDGELTAKGLRPKLRADFPLKHFVCCPVCSKPLTGSYSTGRGGRYGYYHCYKVPRHNAYFSKTDLERDFQEYLPHVSASEGRLQLLKAVIIDTWQTKKKESGQDLEKFGVQIAELEEKQRKTIDLIRDEILTREMGKIELGRIESQINEVRLAKAETGSDKFDVGTAADKWVRSLKKPDRFWLNLKEVEQKVKFQQLVFPEGVVYHNPGFGTPRTGLLFQLIPEPATDKSRLVHPEGVGPSTSSMSTKRSTAELRVLILTLL